MKEVHFNSLDLNLLRLFDALYEERNVTRAGRRLGLTQSAVSHALNRLRYALDDELFIRNADGMNPTARAAEIWPVVRRGLNQLQLAMAPRDFEPARTDRRFTIAASPAVAATLLPPAVARFRKEAPNAELRVRTPAADVVAAVETGSVDLAIGGFGRVGDGVARELLLEERMVWAMRDSHPAAARPLTLDALAELPLLILSVSERPGDTRSGMERRVMIDDGGAWERALAGKTARRRVVVTVEDTHAALAMLSETDLVGLTPRRIAESWRGPRRLKLFDPPYESQPLSLEALWRDEGGPNPGVAWLLGLVREAARDTWGDQSSGAGSAGAKALGAESPYAQSASRSSAKPS